MLDKIIQRVRSKRFSQVPLHSDTCSREEWPTDALSVQTSTIALNVTEDRRFSFEEQSRENQSRLYTKSRKLEEKLLSVFPVLKSHKVEKPGHRRAISSPIHLEPNRRGLDSLNPKSAKVMPESSTIRNSSRSITHDSIPRRSWTIIECQVWIYEYVRNAIYEGRVNISPEKVKECAEKWIWSGPILFEIGEYFFPQVLGRECGNLVCERIMMLKKGEYVS